MQILKMLVLFLAPMLAQAKCLYGPLPLKTTDVYALLSATLKNNTIAQVPQAFTKDKHFCHITIMPPDPQGTVLIAITEYQANRKSKVKETLIEIPKDAVSESRAQCQTTTDGALEKGPIAELEIKAQNGSLIAHLTKDEPSAPYIQATEQNKTITCTTN